MNYMNKNLAFLENQLENKLEDLISSEYLLAIKAEFEAEGTRIDELALLSELCCKKNVALTLKIGGPYAQRDFYEAFQLGASNILVPMIESKYTLQKSFEIYSNFLSIFKNLGSSPDFSFNIESKLGINNIDSIISCVSENNLPIKEIVIGRSDLARSLGNIDVNSNFIFEISKSILIKKKNLEINVGGNLSSKSFEFINQLTSYGLKSFESRKCTFKCSKDLIEEKFNQIIRKGLEFELAWLNYKKKMYSERSEEENNRIIKIKERLLD